MRRIINQHPARGSAILLAALPFILVLAAYLIGSQARLASNPTDKLLPAFSTIGASIQQYAFEPDQRSGKYLLWADTLASLARLGIGLAISAGLALVMGIATGILPYARALFAVFIATLSLIPPLAVLPILFIVFGLGELSKVVLIVIGVAPFLMRDLAMRVTEIPSEQIIKAQTLGASSWQLIVRVILPQILPRLLDALRLSLGAAWLFLIAAEAIASEDGLGYRIFLIRRY
ncbi:MAG: ABC transporter permease subunit, partial [Gammaproteobacteria bacterium]|nr:ABC transporter permease subunit [Gammaproteobacteria bacterium]